MTEYQNRILGYSIVNNSEPIDLSMLLKINDSDVMNASESASMNKIHVPDLL